MYSIEWQKSGLPHAHILIWLKEKIRPGDVDSVIRAEISDILQDPVLFEIVSERMIHGPCGTLNMKSPCMKDKKYEKDTQEKLYAKHRRLRMVTSEQGGHTTVINSRIDNKYHESTIVGLYLTRLFCERCYKHTLKSSIATLSSQSNIFVNTSTTVVIWLL
ncbi:hypothetical protein AVEN_262132-1 [Araneus ventricosus]|uniref:Helitron helicase-like domain-containing protein n=1 Tax=Araneus ventricosus TaxID=182803 RepID=A0A4Y2E759_ARAVE|nr:hypothetical protein AVEN_262132-1 [Araneus ventricosus]